MNNLLEINNYEVLELNHQELVETEGGLGWLVQGLVGGFIAWQICEFANGVYTGIKDELKKG